MHTGYITSLETWEICRNYPVWAFAVQGRRVPILAESKIGQQCTHFDDRQWDHDPKPLWPTALSRPTPNSRNVLIFCKRVQKRRVRFQAPSDVGMGPLQTFTQRPICASNDLSALQHIGGGLGNPECAPDEPH